MNKNKLAAAIIIPFAGLLAACGPNHSHPGQVIGSHASSVANVPGFTQGKVDGRQALINAGVPVNGSTEQQVMFIQSMKSKANRDMLAQKLNIPKGAKRNAFYAQVLKALESDHVASHAGRVQFMVDLENAAVANQ